MSVASALPIFHVIGFTGHRQVNDAKAVERVLGEVLAGLKAEGNVEWLALSSIAAGSDMSFARSALALGMGWETILPLPPAEFRRDFSEAEWREVEQLLGAAEHVRVISERPRRDDAYLDCGMETVNHCDVLLAVWDGEPARGRGGTAEIVAYAREMGRPLVIVDATTFVVRRENFERLKMGDRHLAFFNELPAAPQEQPDTMPGRERVHAFQAKVDHVATCSAPHDRRLTAVTLWLHVAGAPRAGRAGAGENDFVGRAFWKKRLEI
jgi:hypothetical protein